MEQTIEEKKYLRNDPNIVWAFDCGGKPFYQFVNLNNMPPLRGLKTLVLYEELRMKTTLEYLEYHTQATKAILNKTTINIFEINKLNEQLIERLNIAIDTELMLKVASIIIIDEFEDITDYDFDYNAKKIAFWKKNDGMDFFLHDSMQELFPILKDMQVNLEMYSRVLEQKNEMDLENLLQHVPADVRKKLNAKFYSWQAAMPST